MALKADTPLNANVQIRLCLRPQRVPGKAPPCEDDKLQTPGGYHHIYAPVTLPKLKFLEKVK